MPKNKAKAAYSKADMKAVSDNPEWTKEDFAGAKPFGDVLPELAKTIVGRGPQKAPTKVPVNIRLSSIVLEYFKAEGRGWQTKIDDALVEVVTKKTSKKRKTTKKVSGHAA